jgi:ribosomal protein S18 acetylase RimI-like enzyme
MGVYTITEKDKADFEIFFDSETYANIGAKGFFTICYTDDEGFVAGVLQFNISETVDDVASATITYLYVDEDFRNEGAGTILIEELKGILAESGITEVTVEVFSEGSKELIAVLEDEGFAFESEVTYSADLPEEIKVKNTSKNMDKYFIYRLEVPEIDSLEEMEYGY